MMVSDTGRFRSFTPPGGRMFDDAEEQDQIADIIDDLWSLYDDEEWAAELMDQGRLGAFFLKVAKRILRFGESPDVAVFTLQNSLAAGADAS